MSHSKNTEKIALDIPEPIEQPISPLTPQARKLGHTQDALSAPISDIISNSYVNAAKNVFTMAAFLLGMDFTLCKSPLKQYIPFAPRYQRIHIDNKGYAFLILCLIATQYRIKDNEMIGMSSLNHDILHKNHLEELESIRNYELMKKKNEMSFPSAPTPPAALSKNDI